jgi:F0F1-type ATP synthase assembly protein I
MISEVFRQWPANGGEDDQGLMSNGSEQSKLALTLTVVTLFSSNILGGILIGYLLDRWLGSDPWLTITGIVLGLTGAIIGLIRVLNRLNRDN